MPTAATQRRMRGRFYVRSTQWGDVAQAWPRKRPEEPNPEQRQQRLAFGRLVRALKEVEIGEAVAAREIARGTKYTWRDVMSLAMVGRLVDLEGIETAPQYEPGESPVPEGLEDT